MKAVLLGAILGFGSIAPSLAADLPARPYSAPASYVPIGYDWTGLYVGANGGYGRAQDCLRASGPLGVFVEEGCHNAGGGVAGGQVGYRWQFGGAPMVWGLEAQGDWASLRGSHVSLVDPTITNRTKLQGFGLFTGQLGFAFNNVLIYLKGGAAVTSDRYEDITTASGAVLGSVSQTRLENLTNIVGLNAVGSHPDGAVRGSAAVKCDDVSVDHVVIGCSEFLNTLLELPYRVACDRTEA